MNAKTLHAKVWTRVPRWLRYICAGFTLLWMLPWGALYLVLRFLLCASYYCMFFNWWRTTFLWRDTR